MKKFNNYYSCQIIIHHKLSNKILNYINILSKNSDFINKLFLNNQLHGLFFFI